MTTQSFKLNSPIITEQVYKTITDDSSLQDPIAKQYLKSPSEDHITHDELYDPIGDERYSPIDGLVHRYPDRVLFKVTDICAVYCRFCFRKEMVGKGNGVLSEKKIKSVIDYIQNTPQIKEVIFSGGDPLTLSNRRLKAILDQLINIDHLDIIRFHTRAPIVSPQRIDDELLKILSDLPKAVYMVLHINHANEIDGTIQNTLKKISFTPIQLLSQSVLLKGVNDHIDTLENLFRTLIRNNVKPYYLHHMDKAPGTSHFRVPLKKGQYLIKSLQNRISGIAMPRYVMEIPNGYGKMPVNETYFTNCGTHWNVEDLKGVKHKYYEGVEQ